VNLAFGSFPSYLKKINYDLIIFDWSFVGTRVDRDFFIKIKSCISILKEMPGVKICMPQDEFCSMDLMCEFINEFNIAIVFSVASETEWPKLYRTVDFQKVKFIRVLTGYLDSNLVEIWRSKITSIRNRPIDIGYRTVSTAIWGRFNLIKGELASVFLKESIKQNLNVDIAVGSEHFKMGDEWLRFLSNCRYTLGVEGGSSLLDWDGSLSSLIHAFLRSNPNASFDQLEECCIPPGKDGEINVVAISPRHLEACLTRTVQILVEGEYNNILIANIHYIPLKRDFSNINEVFELMGNETARLEMAERAYNDIVASGEYTYKQMVNIVLESVKKERRIFDRPNKQITLFMLLNKILINIDILYLVAYTQLRAVKNSFKKKTI
jgi:hypothetical protein